MHYDLSSRVIWGAGAVVTAVLFASLLAMAFLK